MSRKGALWMLVAVVLWTAAPVFACLPMPHHAALHQCCHPAAQDCCGGTMSVPMACCTAQPSNPGTTPALLSVYEHGQDVVVSLLPAAQTIGVQMAFAEGRSFEIPPPNLSLDNHSILRI